MARTVIKKNHPSLLISHSILADDGVIRPAEERQQAESSEKDLPSTCPLPVASDCVLAYGHYHDSTEDVETEEEKNWSCPPSEKSLRTINPIRAIVDPIVADSVKCGKTRGDGKDQISLALGDPTAYGNFPPCPAVINAITQALQTPSLAAGYVNACGATQAREAIARFYSQSSQNSESWMNVTADDVIIANGCSGALDLALTALLDEGSLLLVPKPGFPLYQVIAESHGAKVIHYNLLPNRRWECDLDHMEKLIVQSENEAVVNGINLSKRVVRGILVNNPSNPTGSVYTKKHLVDIITLARKHRLPIVADEVYGDLTFGDSRFYPLAKLAAEMGGYVPIITGSGLGKQFLVPGWRVGWVVFHRSRSQALRHVLAGAKRLAQVVLGASHLVQCAIPAVLNPASESERASVQEWKDTLCTMLEKQATFTCDKLRYCQGLSVFSPQGAMYAMVRIHTENFDGTIIDDMTFTKLLLDEENVFVLPGRAFGVDTDNYHVFRIVFCAPERQLEEAFSRIFNFCSRHSVQ